MLPEIMMVKQDERRK